jgi:hypothetical protein
VPSPGSSVVARTPEFSADVLGGMPSVNRVVHVEVVMQLLCLSQKVCQLHAFFVKASITELKAR